MSRKLLWLALILSFSNFTLSAQGTYHELAGDTIISRPALVGNAYLLGGKRLNLQVMQWFMSGHPAAHDQIRAAVLTDQMAAVGYSIGGIIFLGGFLLAQDEQAAGGDLMRLGGIGIGSGLLLTIISSVHQKRAVQLYNEDIRRASQATYGLQWELGLGEEGVSLVVTLK